MLKKVAIETWLCKEHTQQETAKGGMTGLQSANIYWKDGSWKYVCDLGAWNIHCSCRKYWIQKKKKQAKVNISVCSLKREVKVNLCWWGRNQPCLQTYQVRHTCDYWCGREQGKVNISVCSRWRRGSGLDCWSDDPGFVSRHTLTSCGPSDLNEVKDVFGRPGALAARHA